MRIEVAYKASPYTTANYLVSAFRRLGHEVYTTGPGHEGVCINPDLFVWVESGGGAPATISYHAIRFPSVAWFIDGHSQGAWHGEFANHFTHVYSAQKGDVGEYLPVACDPETHTPDAGIEPTHDVVFVGHLYAQSPWYQRRRDLLKKLGERYDLKVYEGVYGKDLANAHATGKIVFNVSTLGDVNMRVFEAMCSGRPLITDMVEGLDAGLGGMFHDGEHLLTYTTEHELYEGIDYLIESPEWRHRMGAAGQAIVLAAHTYDHRARTMLEGIGA